MPNFLEYLRQQNIFGAQLPPGPNAIPQPIMGPGIMDSSMQPPMGTDLTPFMPPPQFSMPGINAPDVGRNDPYEVQFGQGPLDINQFDIQQARGGYTPQGPSDFPGPYDAGSRMREMYQPQTDASNRFDQMISNYPQEQNPSWLRRIGAMVMDYTKGSKAGQEYYHEPYNRKVEEWKDKIGPAQQSANLERYENTNSRTLAYQQMSMELREKAQEAKEKNDQRRADILQQRADIYSLRANNPDLKIIIPKGGNVQAFNPRTGETHDTGISSGSMSEIDKITMQGDQRMEQIGASGAQARQTETLRQTGRLEAIGARGTQARETRATPAGGTGDKGLLPTQQKVERYNRARQLANTRPDLADFITPGVGINDFEIAPSNPNAWFASGRGPTPEQLKEINDFIYGPSGGNRSQGAGPGPAAKPITSKPPVAPPGWKYVAKPGGGWTAVPDTGIR
jgi:hypothetical protein